MHIPIRLAAVIAAVLFMLATPLLAQREDTPISPPDSVYSPMWPAARTQTADSANGVVAVVWGTTALSDEQDSLYAAFYAQIIRNGVPVGSPERLGGAGARLANNIRVVPFGDNFLVFYNDYRFGKSLVQFLDGRTGSLRNPYLWSNSPYTINYERRNIMMLGGGNSWRIFWYCPYLVTGTFDSLGKPAISPMRVADTLALDMLSYSWFPGVVIIPDNKGAQPHPNTGIYSRSDGILIPRMPLLRGLFHVGKDSSLLLVNDSTLYFHRSILDTMQQVQKRVLPISQWITSSSDGLVRRDDTGGIALYFLAGVNGKPSTGHRSFTMVVRLRIESFSAPIVADTILIDSLATIYSEYASVTGYGQTQQSNNKSQVYVKFGFEWIYMTLDSGGVPMKSHNGLPPAILAPSTEILPVRLERKDLSVVEVRLQDTVALSVPITTIPHRFPAVTAFPGSIICTWRGIDTSFRDVQARWDLRDDMVKDQNIYSPPPRVYIKGRYRDASQKVHDGIGVFAGNVGVAYNNMQTGIGYLVTSYRDYSEYRYPASTSRYAFARPGENGWKELGKIVEDGGLEGNSLNIMQTGSVIGYDPDYSTVAVLIRKDQHYGSLLQYFLHSYSPTREAWRLENLPVVGTNAMIPMGVKGYIAISGNKGSLVREGKIITSFDLDSVGLLNVRYQKIFGERFARTSWDADDTTRFRVEIFDTAGTRLHTAGIPMPAKTNDYMLLPFRADSSFVILFGGDRGVRGTVLKQDLTPVVVDTLLSATTGRVSRPAGAFRGDTLFLVWEDYRDTASRIYGTYHSGSWLPSSVEEDLHPIATTSDTAAFVYPNPAGDAMTITAYGRNGGGVVYDMSDVLGREILRGRMGEGEIGEVRETVDLSGIPAGTYIVRIWNNGRARSQVVVKR